MVEGSTKRAEEEDDSIQPPSGHRDVHQEVYQSKKSDTIDWQQERVLEGSLSGGIDGIQWNQADFQFVWRD